MSRHLSTYGASQPKADLAQLEFAGRVFELALRLRGSGVSSPERVEALGVSAGIGKREIRREFLPTLEVLGLVDLERDREGAIKVVSEKIPPIDDLYQRADSVLSHVMPEPLEMMALRILRTTTIMPITVSTAEEECAALGPEALAVRAVEDLESLHLCTRQRSADGDEVLFNPNIWAVDKDHSHAALQAEDGAVRAALSGVLEEVAGFSGRAKMVNNPGQEPVDDDRAVLRTGAHGTLPAAGTRAWTGAAHATTVLPRRRVQRSRRPTGPWSSGRR
ncbi:hypothetical protein ACIO1C_33220 [Streptomyces sp. NPDC087420]|uniref:hypothetical protein n=1 Tax=Streptomyces sp. NPDC087420 TaxID=3365785 RepID=UPI003832F096